MNRFLFFLLLCNLACFGAEPGDDDDGNNNPPMHILGQQALQQQVQAFLFDDDIIQQQGENINQPEELPIIIENEPNQELVLQEAIERLRAITDFGKTGSKDLMDKYFYRFVSEDNRSNEMQEYYTLDTPVKQAAGNLIMDLIEKCSHPFVFFYYNERALLFNNASSTLRDSRKIL